MYKPDKTYLITTNAFFFGPDGQQYRAVWGTVRLHQAKELLGLEPNRQSANWYMEVTYNNTSVFVAGCQIHYSVECAEMPFISEFIYKQESSGYPMRWNAILIPGLKQEPTETVMSTLGSKALDCRSPFGIPLPDPTEGPNQ